MHRIVYKKSGGDIEFLLIDDGSTDDSGKICDSYALTDSRIKVIHKKNGGVSSARNTAINKASGKKLIMVDGDDLLLDGAIECARKYLNDDSDILQFDAVPFENIIDISKWTPKGNEKIICGQDLSDYHLSLIDSSNSSINYPTYNMNPAWAKVWDLNFIRTNNLCYDETVEKGEGTLFTFSASYYLKKVTFIPFAFYGYRINPNSIMHRFSSDILEKNNMQYYAYHTIVQKNNETENEKINNALLKRGLYLLENTLLLSVLHIDCKWNDIELTQWSQKLCNTYWVLEAVNSNFAYGITAKIKRYINDKNSLGLTKYIKRVRRNNILRSKMKCFMGQSLISIYRNMRYGRQN